jgi:hypothetical protein
MKDKGWWKWWEIMAIQFPLIFLAVTLQLHSRLWNDPDLTCCLQIPDSLLLVADC